jgi:hypothetical protein
MSCQVANFYMKFELFINKKFTEAIIYQHITEFFQESPHPTGCVSNQCKPGDGAVRQVDGHISRQDKRESQTIGKIFKQNGGQKI